MGSRVREEERNEKIIRGLLKLPGNRRCINCNSLEGGNERAKEIYFKHWDFQGQSVIDSSDVDRLRTFIKNVYVERRYTGQRTGDHLPQTKIQGSQDSHGNSNADSSQGVLRSPYVGTHEDNHGPNRSIEGLSEDQNNSNGHPVSRTMGRGKANFTRNLRSDDLPTIGGKSENNPKDGTASASTVVQASKTTNSNNTVLPIRLPDPPRSQKATAPNASIEAQKSTSRGTNDASSGTMRDAKLYVSKNLIDFDSDLEPSQGVVHTEMQKNPLPPTDVGWATFDDASPKKTTTMPSTSSTNSLEGPMLQIPNSASIPQSRFPTVQTAKSLSFSPANHGSQQHEHYFTPVNNIQSNNSPLNRATSAPVNSQLWRATSHAPIIQGSSIHPSSQGSNTLIGTRDPVIVSASQQPASETTSNRRKELPEDIFTMSYRPVSSAWNWQPNPRVKMEHGQYGMHSPAGFVNFPSLTSMQEALPNTGNMPLFSGSPGMGYVGSVLAPPLLPLTANNQYVVQQHAVKVQNNTFPAGYGVRGFSAVATGYGLSPMDQCLAAQNPQAMTQNPLPRVGGNPFA